jgi:ribosomal protein L11 methyltransferase
VIRLALRVRREEAELVLAELLSLAPSGVEEVDVSPEVIEYAVYGAPGELPSLPAFEAAVGGALVEVSTTEVADDWADRWREFHRPLVLPGLVVRPPWEPALPGPGIDLVIDPGQAFGTGAHATTRLCLEMLLELDPTVPYRGHRLGPEDAAAVDLGCGSGVLAIAAVRLGWAPVLALDFDPLSVEAARLNAEVNSVPRQALEVRRFDLRSAPVPAAPLVLANLLAPLLLIWCSQLAAGRAEVPDMVIASGLLAREADALRDAFAGVGLVEAGRREHGEWAALLLRRSSDG